MITLEQVRLLDQKVSQAVDLIGILRTENRILNEKLESYQNKIGELEILLSGLKEDQVEVEQGFQKALAALNVLENEAAEFDTEEIQNQDEENAEETIEPALEAEETEDDFTEPEMEEEIPSNTAELDIF